MIMKNFKFWGLILVSAMCAGLTACGGDDESSSSSSNGGNTKRIKKISWLSNSGGIRDEKNFTYNEYGQVIQEYRRSIDAGFTQTTNITFTYNQNTIKAHKIVQSTYQNTETDIEYRLENGRIVEKKQNDKVIERLTYDEAGYLKTLNQCEWDNSWKTIQYTWKDGNLIKRGNTEFFYSDMLRPEHWLTYGDDVLMAFGYYGKTSKNLELTSFSTYKDNYEYTIKDGYVIKYAITYTHYSTKSEYIIEWE